SARRAFRSSYPWLASPCGRSRPAAAWPAPPRRRRSGRQVGDGERPASRELLMQTLVAGAVGQADQQEESVAAGAREAGRLEGRMVVARQARRQDEAERRREDRRSDHELVD